MILRESDFRRRVRRELRAALYTKQMTEDKQGTQEKQRASKNALEQTLKDATDDPEDLKALFGRLKTQVDAAHQAKDENCLHEVVLASAILGTLLSAPAFLEILGFFVHKLSKAMSKLKIVGGAKNAEDYAETLTKTGHTLQRRYFKMIALFLKPFVKDDKIRGKLAKGIFIVMCAVLAANAGFEIADAAQHGFEFLHGYESILAGIKTGEVGRETLTVLNAVLSAEGLEVAAGAAVAATKAAV